METSKREEGGRNCSKSNKSSLNITTTALKHKKIPSTAISGSLLPVDAKARLSHAAMRLFQPINPAVTTGQILARSFYHAQLLGLSNKSACIGFATMWVEMRSDNALIVIYGFTPSAVGMIEPSAT